MTARIFSAQEAAKCGLVNRVVEPEALLPTCQALAAQMATCVPQVLKGYKKLIDTGFGMHLSDALCHERAAGTESAKAISAATLAARREGVLARGREQSDLESGG